ncbi:hypothetical protein, partial [Burkholderia sp. SIMBA_024]|uniref:hypothetical protein n=1 Tax=Burkholderia sp. SIMBA_024 TaxID=3085768 RepID=UPI00397CA11D
MGKSQFADPMFIGSIDAFKSYPRALRAAEIAAEQSLSQISQKKSISSNSSGQILEETRESDSFLYPNPVTEGKFTISTSADL